MNTKPWRLFTNKKSNYKCIRFNPNDKIHWEIISFLSFFYRVDIQYVQYFTVHRHSGSFIIDSFLPLRTVGCILIQKQNYFCIVKIFVNNGWWISYSRCSCYFVYSSDHNNNSTSSTITTTTTTSTTTTTTTTTSTSN